MYLANSNQITLPCDGGNCTINGPADLDPKFTNIASLVSNALPLIFSIAGVILLAMLLWGGFDYLTAMGDPKKAEAARGKITNAILGFFLIFAAYWITQIIIFLFRLNGTNSNLPIGF